MKKSIVIISLLFTAILISSCREIDVKTIVNKDGSFTRIITITGDSTDVYRKGLPYPIDESWDMYFSKDTTSEKSYKLTYTKTFDGDKPLNQELASDTSWRRHLTRNISVDRTFGFFYSYLTYNETIGAANPFTELDYRNYISDDDILWLTESKLAINSSDSAKIKQAEDNAESFIKKSFKAAVINMLTDGVVKLKDADILIQDVHKFQDSISAKVEKWDYNSTSEFVDYFAKLTKNKNVLKIKENSQAEIKELNNKIELLYEIFGMEDYNVIVEMPGLLTSTNSLSIKGNRVNWNVNTMSFLFKDFQLVSESRIVNSYMFIIAGILLLLVVILAAIRLWK